MTTRAMTCLMAGLAMVGLMGVAHAGSELEDALAAGGQRLTADELFDRLSGKTVTFVSAGTGDEFLVFYGADNEGASRKVGSDAVSHGFQAITDRDQVCLGWDGRDLPRLRCMDVLLIDGVMHKFKADGSLSGRIIAITDGNTT